MGHADETRRLPRMIRAWRYPDWLERVVAARPVVPAQPLQPLTLALILGLLAVWRASILAFAYILDQTGSVTCGVGVERPWKYSACWDVQNYQIIAANGYQDTPEHVFRIAFFPLYPLLMRWGRDLSPGGGDVRAGVIVGHLALAVAAVYIYRLVRLDFDERVSWRTVGYLLMFPSAFFFTAAYTEPLFLLAVAGALYHARRGQWLAAGIFAAGGSATKLIGILLALPLLVEALAQRPDLRRAWYPLLGVALAPLGAVAYFAYLQWRFGDFGIFFDAQRNWARSSWRPTFHMGIDRLLGDSTTMLEYYPRTITPIPTTWILLDTTLLMLFLAAGVVLWLRVRQSYGALLIAGTLMLGFSGNPQSMNRYLVVFFPAFILLGQIRWEPVRLALAIAFTAGLMAETYFFVNGLWAG